MKYKIREKQIVTDLFLQCVGFRSVVGDLFRDFDNSTSGSSSSSELPYATSESIDVRAVIG